MKVLFSIALFAVAAIGSVVGQARPIGRSLDGVQDEDKKCNTALDALMAVSKVIEWCGWPDMVIVM